MPTLEQYKEEICHIGDRLYKRGFAAANDGNITYRIGENEVLCTPTLTCKGFLKPEDICLIDMQGNQLAGVKKRTSEALLHLEIMQARADVKSVVHCHPPHATAFAVAHEAVPSCVLPEIEFYLGNVPISKYETPGTKKFAETILPFVNRAYVIILANHGTVSYGETVERAYWRTEALDASCEIFLLAKQIGRLQFLSSEHTWELIEAKKTWGIADPRHDPRYRDSDLFVDDVYRETWNDSGVTTGAFGAPAWSRAATERSNGAPPPLDDATIERIAERVAAKLRQAN